jgi:uncharacterized SAM-binding protein YcdF (DUF218 family)
MSNKPTDKKTTDIKAAAKTVWDFLNLTDPPQAADIIFIFGGATLDPALKAIELYMANYASKIAFVSKGGGTFSDKNDPTSEVKRYMQVLLDKKISQQDIICEELSSNTLQEAQKAIPFLKKNGLDPQTMILVSRPVHQKRAWATFAKQWPEINYINCPADEQLDMGDNKLLLRLVQETERLVKYGTKGDLVPQDIPEKVLVAVELLKKI